MSSSIVILCLAMAVTINAGLIRPMLGPMPFIGPIAPPMMGPIIRPFIHPVPHVFPIFPRIQRKTVFRPRRVTRPRSRPFVMETPDMFHREDQPFIINIVDSRDPVKEVVYMENKKQPVPVRYFEDSNNGDISIDGNVYISDPYATTSLQQGATVEQVVSTAMGNGQLATGNKRMDFDYPLPNLSPATII